MADLMLRKASADDGEFAYRVRRAAFRQYVERVGRWDEDEQRQIHDRRFQTQDDRVISLAGKDVGIIAIAVQRDCLKVNQLLVMPEHQGKDIGRRCMLQILDVARRLHLPVRLRVMTTCRYDRTTFEQRVPLRSGGQADQERLIRSSEELNPFAIEACVRAGLRSQGTAIDVGCGPVGALIALAEVVGPEGRVAGLDSSHEALALARVLRDPGPCTVDDVDITGIRAKHADPWTF